MHVINSVHVLNFNKCYCISLRCTQRQVWRGNDWDWARDIDRWEYNMAFLVTTRQYWHWPRHPSCVSFDYLGALCRSVYCCISGLQWRRWTSGVLYLLLRMSTVSPLSSDIYTKDMAGQSATWCWVPSCTALSGQVGFDQSFDLTAADRSHSFAPLQKGGLWWCQMKVLSISATEIPQN